MTLSMKAFVIRAACLPAVLSLGALAQAQTSAEKAPTPNPPLITRQATSPAYAPPPPQPGPPVPWSIGQPTDDEQLYLEYINRARANPSAEGARLAASTDPDVLSSYDFFNVDLALMQSQFNAIAPAPPLAMNYQLLTAARLHSGDMFTNMFQGHNSTGGATLPTRVLAQGYNYQNLGENVFSYAEGAWHGHAGFNVDWGTGPGGMQTPPGHRESIHNPTFREVGIGVVNGMNGPVGPQLVTQDFGTRQGATPLITGVVYYDLNGNSFYDAGEGIGGVEVQVPGSMYYAVTADSGGYAVPVTTNGSYSMQFSATGISTQRQATVTALRNVKVDWVPAYTPPVLSGPNPASLNGSNYFSFNAVGAATAYDWQRASLVAFATEGAENGTARVLADVSAYPLIVTDVKAGGSASFHLAHLSTDPRDQTLELANDIRLESNSTLNFAKRLGFATSAQEAMVQVSLDQGTSWTTVWSQVGTQSAESSFSTINLPLNAYAGRVVRLRFVYAFYGGTYYPGSASNLGLHLDNISITGAQEVQAAVITSVDTTRSFVFTPTTAGDYLLRARARIQSRILPWGPATVVSAAAVGPAPLIQLVNPPVVAGGQAHIEFIVTNHRPGMTFQLHQATEAAGPYTQATATLQTVTEGTRYRYTVSTAGTTRRFYKVLASY